MSIDKTIFMTWKCFSPFIFCTSFIILLFGCNKQQNKDNCLSYKKAPGISIVGANTALVNQEVVLTVSFGCFNGCGQFGNFEETIAGNTSTINVNAKYEGCICTQDAPIRTALYKFKKSQTGTYELKFFQGENSYLSYTIIVQ